MTDTHTTTAGAAGEVFTGTADPAASPAIQPGAAGEPTEPASLPSSKAPALSGDQARDLAADLIAHGVPRDQVEAALKADGLTVDLDAPDARTDEQKDFDAYFGPTPPASAYKIEYFGRVPEGTEGPALAEYHAQATAWLSQLGFPENIGPAVMERAIDAGQAYNRMSEPQRQLWVREQNAEFERMAGGPEKAAERMKFAAVALARAPGAFTDALRANGSLHEAGVVLHLANQGERLAARG